MRLKSSSQNPTCCFCGKDKTPLSEIPNEMTNWVFQFPVYGCTECMGDENKMNLLKEITIIRRLENLYVSIHFDGHFFVNPSGVYIPFLGLSGNLRFLCVNKKCSLKVSFSDPSDDDCLFNESSIHGCVIDPQSEQITTESVSIVRIILGVCELNRILELDIKHPYVKMLVEFESMYPNLRIEDAIQQSPPESYVGPRINDFMLEDPASVLRLFSLLVSGIYSNDVISEFLSGMKQEFLDFIRKSMISMMTFMRRNGFEKIPSLKEEKPSIEDFLVKNYETVTVLKENDIICQNFRHFLKLFRKILRYLYSIDDSSLAIELFQFCRFLYATLHVSNQAIYHRLTRQIPFEKCSPYFNFLKRYVMSASPFCVEIFTMIPASQTKLDICSFCQRKDSASVIGKCPQHNICCLECFPIVVKQWTTCPSCRNCNFLP
jgi:hypothetical protein